MRKAVFLIAVSLVGCAPANAGLCSKFEYQIKGDPIARARAHFNTDDNRFLAVHGITIMIPGFEGRSEKPKEYEIISGTDDSIEDDSCFSFRMDAIAYARKFNVEMESLLKSRHR